MQSPPISIHHNKHIRALSRQPILDTPERTPPRTINRPRPILLRPEILKFPATLVPAAVGTVVDKWFFARGVTAVAKFGKKGEAVVGGLLVVFGERLRVVGEGHALAETDWMNAGDEIYMAVRVCL